MESSSRFLEVDGTRVNYIGPNNYKIVALSIGKDQIPSLNGFFYFEVEILNNGNDGFISVGFCTKLNIQILLQILCQSKTIIHGIFMMMAIFLAIKMANHMGRHIQLVILSVVI